MDIGLNLDGDGYVVGLWISAERAVIDENIYVYMTLGELRALADKICSALPLDTTNWDGE